jgi:hypothetical protein
MANTTQPTTQTFFSLPFMAVVAGFTTIPSRLRNGGVGVRPTLASLAAQSRPLSAIVMVVPLKSMRGTLPGVDAAAVTAADIRALQLWYSMVVVGARGHGTTPPLVVHRPMDDLGPIMKYVGTAEALAAESPRFAVIVDDDREYPPGFVGSLAAQAARLPANAVDTTVLSQQTALQRLHPKLLSVFGFAGVWVPVAALQRLAARTRALAAASGPGPTGSLPRFAALNDDVLAAILMDKDGTRIRRFARDTPRVPRADDSEDALSAAAQSTKTLQIMQCHYAYNQPFATAATAIAVLLLLVMLALVVVGAVYIARAGKTARRKAPVT